MSLDLQSPLQGTVLIVDVEVGDQISEGQRVALLESMKMEHEVLATSGGVITKVCIEIGQMVAESEKLFSFDARETPLANEVTTDVLDLTYIRPDLAETIERHEIGRDHRRKSAVEKRHLKGQRTARENIADLTDGGELVEYGPLAIAPQRKRRSVDDLILNTPADGMVGGLAEVNSDLFDENKTQCVVISYDYTVLAGTQGGQNHRKKDRLFEIAKKWKLPVVFFTEGGGGRPGDTDGLQVAGLDCLAFGLWAELSGDVPLVGITSGYCFAGNAAILGCCDVIIATEDANIGMGGPAMIEGGGLGKYHPSEIGPMETQTANGVVDILVKDEQEAVQIAKKYLSYFQGEITGWDSQDQRTLRHLVPENRLRAYDIRKVIDVLFDTNSVLELRKDFGLGMITSLARIEGKPVGVIANNPGYLGGAIDADAADKASRFMQLCDAHDLPIISLCDTPGFMVGPEAEKSGLVRHVSRMFVNARSVTVPTGTIVLRKAYGLGAQAMASGGFKFPMFTISWPTGEFGGMGLEGAVKLGYRKDLEAINDPEEREQAYQNLVEKMYEAGKGLSMADHFEIDDVIDPQDSRQWVIAALRAAGPGEERASKKRPMIDTW
ncbi:MAG: carboxyl transferase domain-containing protein [Actinomycetota bacterium]|nr:carboxyl transferase domain-containing protein [Actinomycetota bacterium]